MLKPKTSEPKFIQDEINNLDKYMKFIQAPVKTMPFYLLPHYKSLQSQGEQNEKYWNEITIVFLDKKHNIYMTRKELPIEIYSGGLLYELYFIALTLQGQIIIGPIKKMVVSCGWRLSIVGLIYENINVKREVLLQSPPHVYLTTTAWTIGWRVSASWHNDQLYCS